eukprot:scaffold14488_cov131-Isochrysis_galbana.AAC.3
MSSEQADCGGECEDEEERTADVTDDTLREAREHGARGGVKGGTGETGTRSEVVSGVRLGARQLPIGKAPDGNAPLPPSPAATDPPHPPPLPVSAT